MGFIIKNGLWGLWAFWKDRKHKVEREFSTMVSTIQILKCENKSINKLMRN